MQEQNSNSKKILYGGVAAVLVAIALWFFFFRNASPEISVDEFGNPVEAQVVGKDLIDLLTTLQKVELDSSVLRSAAFLNLTDFGIVLSDQPRGRANPFDKLSSGGSISVASQQATTKK